MPLSAFLDGQIVCAPLLDDNTWRSMRGSTVTLTCGHPGFARTSALGTHHFVHTSGSGCSHPESAEHLHLKAVVAQAAAKAGWSASTETAGDGFIADVLVEHGDARVAFEVQWSRQVLHEYQRRQAVYARAGIRCVWLAKKVPTGHQATADLPLFVVRQWNGEPQVVVTGRCVPIAELVPALLSGRCRWREDVQADRMAAETMRVMCPMCGECRHVETTRWLTGTCSCGLPLVRLGKSALMPERAKCCGYWGPRLSLGIATSTQEVKSVVATPHWCLSA